MTYHSPALGDVEAAVRADLARWGDEVARTGLAAIAINAAQTLDDRHLSATPRSMLIAQLRETMLKLAELAPEPEENDAIDKIARDLEARRGA